VQRWERSPMELPDDSAGSILILADPDEPPSAAERRALQHFVDSGGQVLFTGPDIEHFFADAKVSDADPFATADLYSANIPSALTRGAYTVKLQAEATWTQLGPGQTMGNGRILWWAGPAPLTNAGISSVDNLNLLLDAIRSSPVGNGAPVQIYWDEYFHGERSSLWSYAQNTPVAWGVLQLSVLAVGVLFTFSRRNGPTAIPAGVSRLSPLEFVDTLGGLYQRAHAEPAVVGIVYQRFRILLARQMRLPSQVDDATLDAAIRSRLGRNFDGLPDTLRRGAAATQAQKVTPAEALALIRQLEQYEEQLGLKKTAAEEKS
jgi:uncharacterized protein DUF4350